MLRNQYMDILNTKMTDEDLNIQGCKWGKYISNTYTKMVLKINPEDIYII